MYKRQRALTRVPLLHIEWQREAKLRTFSRLALHGHITVMGAQNLAGDGKPHACADGLPLGTGATVESLENSRQVAFRNARAVVANCNDKSGFGPSRHDRERRARR